MKIKRVEENFNYNYERFSTRLTNNKRTINAIENGMMREANLFFIKLDANISIVEEQFTHNYTRLHRYLDSLNNDIGLYEKAIEREARRWYLTVVKRITDCERMLLACDPQLKLKQGFSIVKDKTGKVVKSKKTVKICDIITVQLFDGVLDSKVEDIR
jgi:exonuclease VII large subunit